MEDGACNKHVGATSGKTDRQLKELRRLMPWNWDARVEEHPPGEKAMQDFEDVVNYRIDGRKRRHMPAAPEIIKGKGKNKSKKVSKKKEQSRTLDDENNKENIPPLDYSPAEKESSFKKPEETPRRSIETPKPAKGTTAGTITATVPISPAFVLTPADEITVSTQKKRKNVPQGRPSKLSGCEKKRNRTETGVKKRQPKKVSFHHQDDEKQPSPRNTARIVNFNDTIMIDPTKYGNGVRLKRPRECPPLFRTLEMHGRKMLPDSPENIQSVLREPLEKSAQPRTKTPYMGSGHVTSSGERYAVISEIIEHGLKLREAAHRPAVIPPYKPLELSSKLAWAISQL